MISDEVEQQKTAEILPKPFNILKGLAVEDKRDSATWVLMTVRRVYFPSMGR